MHPTVLSVSAHPSHTFSKSLCARIDLIAGQGVAGDAHCGEKVKHRSRVRQDPNQPNLRQIHLIHTELFAELASEGFVIGPGDLGENITTQGIALLDLPRGTLLHIGEAVIEVTGLRNPCSQIEAFRSGLLAKVVHHGPDGKLIRKAGIMGVVRISGQVQAGDAIRVTLPPGPHVALERV